MPLPSFAPAAGNSGGRRPQRNTSSGRRFGGPAAAGSSFGASAPEGPAIVDFFCPALRLVIEVDGGIHQDPDQAAHDAARDALLSADGITILRVSNNEVAYQLDHVLHQIIELAATTRNRRTAQPAPPDMPDR